MERFVPNSEQFAPEVKRSMSTAAYINDAEKMARALERRLVARGHSSESARHRVANKIGCSPGTLLSLSKARLKRIDGWLHDRLRQTLISEYENEIGALTNELSRLRQSGINADSLEIQEIETCLEKARQMLCRASSSPMAPGARR